MTDRIEKTIAIAAPVERVWNALTDHEEFGTWFRVKLDGPFALGELSTGRITHSGYEHLKWEARVVAMEAPRLFAFTWHPYAVDPERDYSVDPQTRVEFRLEPAVGGTSLTVVESGFDSLPADRRDEALRMNTGGWEAQMKNVKAHAER
ncbi:MAG TPA: SRPBCC family protein [Allosphingosinicella sp.]|nr:SRPBCC family protein [Allosphingosinicella sp.]